MEEFGGKDLKCWRQLEVKGDILLRKNSRGRHRKGVYPCPLSLSSSILPAALIGMMLCDRSALEGKGGLGWRDTIWLKQEFSMVLPNPNGFTKLGSSMILDPTRVWGKDWVGVLNAARPSFLLGDCNGKYNSPSDL